MDAPEFKLLLACCCCSYSEAAKEEVHRGSAGVDWQVFMRLVRRHRVQGLVAQAFSTSVVSPPAEVAAKLGEEWAAVAQANLRAAIESGRLLKAFDEASIGLLFVKGLTLSALAYGNPFTKMSADIDILVHPRDVGAAVGVLTQLGYAPRSSRRGAPTDYSAWHKRHKESAWISSGMATVLELHSRLADHPTLIPDIGIGSPLQMVAVGSHGSLPTLNTPDLLVYLCVHGASSAWFRLKWIVDLIALMHSSGADAEAVFRGASDCGVGRAAAQALLLADRLSLIRLPDDFRAELAGDRASRLLADVALSQLLAATEPTRRSFGTAAIHLSQALLLPGLRFKVSEIGRQAVEILDRRF